MTDSMVPITRKGTASLTGPGFLSSVQRMSSEPPPLDFDALVREHYPHLFRFALGLCKQKALAEDLTQRCFLTFARKGSQIRDTSKAKSWLFTTLYRDFLSQKKRDARMESLDDEASHHQPMRQEADQRRALDGKIVMEALHELDETYRAPLTLFYVNDYTYREIAETLGIPIGTVMSRLSRGKEALKARLQPRHQPS